MFLLEDFRNGPMLKLCPACPDAGSLTIDEFFDGLQEMKGAGQSTEMFLGLQTAAATLTCGLNILQYTDTQISVAGGRRTNVSQSCKSAVSPTSLCSGPAQAKQCFMIRKRVEQIWTGSPGPSETLIASTRCYNVGLQKIPCGIMCTSSD